MQGSSVWAGFIGPVASEPLAHRPFTRFDLARYIAEPEARRSFWLRAHITKKREIAEALSSLRERDDVVQEARLDFGAEQWGLVVGSRAGEVATPAPPPPGPEQV